MAKKSDLLIGILGAAAAGVVIGMLIAPEKGKDMRKKIKQQADDLSGKVGDMWAKGKTKAENAYNDAVSRGKDLLNKGKEAYNKNNPEETFS